MASPDFFFDGVPFGITLFVGPAASDFKDEELRSKNFSRVLQERHNFVQAFEAMATDSSMRLRLTTRHNAGLGDEVPGPARCLVDMTRSVCRGLKKVKAETCFHQCENCNCNRLFYKGKTSETWSTAATTQSYLDEDQNTSDKYWSEISCSKIDEVPDSRRFCSRACRNQHSEHLRMMMPDFGLHMDADDYAKKTDRPRVLESLKLCLKRNEIAARALRTMRSKGWPNLAVDADEIEAHRQKHITALNVDIGILYAASVIAESKTLSDGKILPGQHLYWRDNPWHYGKSIGAVVKTYKQTKREEGIIFSLLTMPKFVERLRANAHRMF